jgi:chromosome segregation ATPase
MDMAETGGTAETPQTAAPETRKRLAQWVEEGQSLLSFIPRLLDEHDQLKAKAEAAGSECEKLRQEISGLRNENQLLRNERTEFVETFGNLLNQAPQLMNEMLQKVRGGPRKSPFEPPTKDKPSA